jgi:hypothetical protein
MSWFSQASQKLRFMSHISELLTDASMKLSTHYNLKEDSQEENNEAVASGSPQITEVK